MRGPAPSPTALRRDRPSDQASWVDLPPRREGPVPEWPFDGMTERQKALWDRLWAMPQAVMWERNQQAIEVAIHVDTLIDVQYGVLLAGKDEKTYLDSPAPHRALALRQMKELGLTSGDLMRLRWRIDTGEPPAKPGVKRTNDSRRTSAKARFEAITGGRTA